METNYKDTYTLCLKDGTTCEAKLIHFNSRFHTKYKVPDQWRREDNGEFIKDDEISVIIK